MATCSNTAAKLCKNHTPDAMPSNAMPRHATPRSATPRRAASRHLTSGHASPRHASPRHATPRDAMLGREILYTTTSWKQFLRLRLR